MVAGADASPNPTHEATLRALVDRWPEVKRAIARFAAELSPDHHVPLDPPTLGGFAAKDCGFDQELYFETIIVTDVDAPERARVTFYTGYPDGYATFETVLVAGKPTAITAFAS